MIQKATRKKGAGTHQELLKTSYNIHFLYISTILPFFFFSLLKSLVPSGFDDIVENTASVNCVELVQRLPQAM